MQLEWIIKSMNSIFELYKWSMKAPSVREYDRIFI